MEGAGPGVGHGVEESAGRAVARSWSDRVVTTIDPANATGSTGLKEPAVQCDQRRGRWTARDANQGRVSSGLSGRPEQIPF